MDGKQISVSSCFGVQKHELTLICSLGSMVAAGLHHNPANDVPSTVTDVNFADDFNLYLSWQMPAGADRWAKVLLQGRPLSTPSLFVIGMMYF